MRSAWTSWRMACWHWARSLPWSTPLRSWTRRGSNVQRRPKGKSNLGLRVKKPQGTKCHIGNILGIACRQVGRVHELAQAISKVKAAGGAVSINIGTLDLSWPFGFSLTVCPQIGESPELNGTRRSPSLRHSGTPTERYFYPWTVKSRRWA